MLALGGAWWGEVEPYLAMDKPFKFWAEIIRNRMIGG